MPRLSKIGAAALAAFGFSSGAAAVTASYLVVAGGGSGGGASQNVSGTSAGGGAGGYQTGTTSLVLSTSYTVTVGAGGAAVSSSTATGNSGSNSSFGTLTASVGGGFGQSGNASSAGAGGSGGGAANSNLTGGTATSGQGNAGGATTVSFVYAGGGGGAGAAGSNGNASNSGAGGAGTASSITGSSVTYAGGGGGGGSSIAGAGAGGSGGGGGGGANLTTGTSGTSNTGGGGGAGGAGNNGTVFSGSGGSGIVIISYTGAQQFGGGVITTDGTNTIHTFTTSGVLSPISSLSASYLIVAGGAGGGSGAAGGGGAGGLLASSVTIDTNSTYTVTVGAGGAAGSSSLGGNGGNSIFSAYATTAVGGGGGGYFSGTTTGQNGGSGGGGSYSGSAAGGTGTASQGNNGGAGATNGSSYFNGGGGGGSSAVGATATSGSAGNGGAGTASSISGSSVTYAGGGGGGAQGTAGSGGSGGGGAGGTNTVAGTAGTTNLGSGGGGGGGSNANGGAGGSGIVIISYAGATQSMAGGTVTIVGGNVIHTFTSSGYLTPLTYYSNSLRFRSSASAYLSRTPTVASNRKTWTWSGWLKRGAFNAGIFQGFSGGNSTSFSFSGAGNTTLLIQDYTSGSYNLTWETSAVFRDPAAWYHFVCVYDTTQASSANAVKVYVNGVQQTLTFTAVNGSYVQNRDSYVNATNAQNIGTYAGVANYQDGYMTNINFIDGQALTPNSFGTFNSYGVWQPINYGGSYGTNGFYLPFTNNASTTTLGYDFSPQGNNWTTNNISVTAGATYDSMTDVPTLTSATAANYCVLNPLSYSGIGTYLSNANLTISGQDEKWCMGTMGVTTGKWYWEVSVGSATYSAYVGVINVPFEASDPDTVGINTANLVSYIGNNNYKDYTASSSTALVGTTKPAVWGIALDLTAGTISYYVANTLYHTDSTLPSNGSKTFFPMNATTNSGGPNTWTANSYNFGQQPFTYTPPTGYVALNTYNL